MPHELAFKTTVEPVTELLIMQLTGAMQIIAALVLTDEEGEELCQSESGDCRPSPSWIAEMRKDLLSPQWRPVLIEALKKRGFMTNTHPGWALEPLAEVPRSHWKINACYLTLEAMLQEYAEGKGEYVTQDHRAYWTAQLIAAGHDAEVVNYALESEGYTLAMVATMERIARPLRKRNSL